MGDIIITVVLIVVCIFVFLFVFWRGLKEDYIPSQIFTTSFAVIFAASIAFLLSEFFFKQYRFWFLVTALIIGYVIGSKKSGVKFYEGWDSVVVALLLSLIASVVALYRYWNINWILFYLSITLSLIIFFTLKKVYKTFIWYKSGKRGFPGLFTIGIFFLIRSVISFVKPDFTLMLTEYDMFFSGLISFMSFLNIFVLANK